MNIRPVKILKPCRLVEARRGVRLTDTVLSPGEIVRIGHGVNGFVASIYPIVDATPANPFASDYHDEAILQPGTYEWWYD